MLAVVSLVSVTSCDFIEDLLTETVEIRVGEYLTPKKSTGESITGLVSDNPFVASVNYNTIIGICLYLRNLIDRLYIFYWHIPELD